MSRCLKVLVGVVVLVLGTGTAGAQVPVFPADAAWVRLTQGAVNIGDPAGDSQVGRDLVGDTANPAAFVHSDAAFLYFRVRLDTTPLRRSNPLEYRPFGWACALDINSTITDYELVAGLDGINNPDVVELSQNTVKQNNDPSDIAEVLIRGYSPLTHSAVTPAGTSFNGNPDFFLSWAVAWTDVTTGGLAPNGPIHIYCGSSNNARSLAADLISNNGGTTLSAIHSDPFSCGPGGCFSCTIDSACGDTCQPCAGNAAHCLPATHTCVECVVNAHCGGTTPFCNTATNTCRSCQSDSECGGATPACQANGSCGQCSATNSTRCGGNTPLCNPTTGQCRGCSSDAECTDPANPACEPSGRCGQCSATNETLCTGATPACDTGTGTCVGCRNDTDCTDAAAPACQPGGTCGQCSLTNAAICLANGQVCNVSLGVCVAPGGCISDAQCTDPTRPACQASGQCAPCSATNTGLCTGSTPVCETSTGTCRGCSRDPDCTDPAAPACQASGACGQCSSTSGGLCTGNTPICDTAAGTCVGCRGDTDCTDAAVPACQPGGTCGQCSGTNGALCTGGNVCNTSIGQCVPPGGCSSDASCTDPAAPACQPSGQCGECSGTNATLCTGGSPVCDTTTLLCRACQADAECPSGQVCDEADGVCRPTCAANGDCTPPTPFCDVAHQFCVGCRTSADCSGSTPVCNAATRLCEACSGDSDCTSTAAPACQPSGSPLAGRCGQCSATNTAACPTSAPLCNVVTATCVDGCRNDTDCLDPLAPFCDNNTRACLGCRSNDDCGGTRPYCNPQGSVCQACQGSGTPFCTDPQRPVCQTQGNLAGACSQCAAGETGLCTPTEPLCLTDLGLCGCNSADGDSECGSSTSGLICNGPAGICVPGCSTAASRNGCPGGQSCSDTTGMVGLCIDGCTTDNDCEAPLGRCNGAAGNAQCVQCLGNSDCASPYVCDLTTSTCRECTDTDSANCREEVSGAQCLGDGTCGCDADDDCGGPGSERVCDLGVGRCTYGCRGEGGNGCLPGRICTSTDATIGTCQPIPTTDGGVDGGDGGDDGGVDAGADGGDAGDGAIADAGGDAATDGPRRDVGNGGPDLAGRPDAGGGSNVAGGGCSCTVSPSADPASSAGSLVLFSLALLGLLWPRRRSR